MDKNIIIPANVHGVRTSGSIDSELFRAVVKYFGNNEQEARIHLRELVKAAKQAEISPSGLLRSACYRMVLKKEYLPEDEYITNELALSVERKAQKAARTERQKRRS